MALASPQSVLGLDYLITQLKRVGHGDKQEVIKSKQDLLESVWKCDSPVIKLFGNTYNWILIA